MEIGDLVVRKSGDPLRSGAEEYPHAVVVSLDPFVCISEAGDMLWSATVTLDAMMVVGKASPVALGNAKGRWQLECSAQEAGWQRN